MGMRVKLVTLEVWSSHDEDDVRVSVDVNGRTGKLISLDELPATLMRYGESLVEESTDG